MPGCALLPADARIGTRIRSSTAARALVGYLWVMLGTAGGVATASAAAVETFVMAVGGQSTLIAPFGCATFGSPAPVASYFGAIPPSVPTDGLSTCKVAGGYRHTSAPSGTLTDSTAIDVTFNTTQPVPNTMKGSSDANARSGKAGARAHAEFTGPYNGFIVSGTNAFGKFTDSLTLRDPLVPDGTPGQARLGITVAGSVAVAYTGSFISTGDVEVNYRVGTGPIFTLMRAQVNNASPFVATVNGTASFAGQVLDGFTLGAGSVTGAGQIMTFLFPITWGQPFDFTLGVLAAALPGTGGSVTTDFLASALITQVDAFAFGQPVTGFSVTSGSGAIYTAQGVVIPVPPSLLLLALPVVGLAAARRRTTGAALAPGGRAPTRADLGARQG